MKFLRRFFTGAGLVTLAALWAAFDALVHVAIDMVEPPRIAGNIAVWVACAVSIVAVRVVGRPKLAGLACGLAAGVVLGFNMAWVIVEGALPAPAAVFFGLALLLLLLAAWRFFGEAAVSNSVAIDASDSSRSTVKRSKVWVGATALLFAVAMAVKRAAAQQDVLLAHTTGGPMTQPASWSGFSVRRSLAKLTAPSVGLPNFGVRNGRALCGFHLIQPMTSTSVTG